MLQPLFVSIIVPCKTIDTMIIEDLWPALARQTYRNFELILVPDGTVCTKKLPPFVKVLPQKFNPAAKRDFGVAKARGSIIVFIDGDAYPATKDWLKLIVEKIADQNVAAVCGPGLTPVTNNLRQHLSGYVWSSWVGAGGAGTYRNKPQKKREVDDYPTFNLAVKKDEFLKAGGFNTKFWPGEDTVLCHELVYKSNMKIVYYPEIQVFHHRRPLLEAHLKQVSRYGLHRGYFSKILPKTSRRLGYYIPAAFVVYLLAIVILSITVGRYGLLILPFYVYLLLLILSATKLLWQNHNLIMALLLPPAIFVTHVVYGLMFIKGVLAADLKS